MNVKSKINVSGKAYFITARQKDEPGKVSFGSDINNDKFVSSRVTGNKSRGVSSILESFFTKSKINESKINVKQKKDIHNGKVALYADTKAFSEYLTDKMNKLLENPSEEEVKTKIGEVCKLTCENEEVVTDVMSRLTQFSGWSSLPELEKSFQNSEIHEISPFFLDKKHTISDYTEVGAPKTCDLTINDVLKYVCSRKWQMTFSQNGVSALFLDNAQLKQLETLKNEQPAIIRELGKEIKSGSTKLFAIDGWNVTSDGKDVSYGLFGASCDIKDATVEVVNKMKREGISLDEALNSDTLKRAKMIFGEDTQVEIIKNNAAENNSKMIAFMMSSPYPDAKRTERVINTIIKNCLPKKYPEEKARILLNQYFDEMLTCHSSRTMTKELKSKHKEIAEIAHKFGTAEDDLVYIIPNNKKSYNLISYQYAKANDIKDADFVYYSGRGDFPRDINGKEKNLAGKTLVILDDFVGTGYSFALNGFYYNEFRSGLGRNSHIIMAPLVAQRSGIDFIEDTIDRLDRVINGENSNKDILSPGKTVDFEAFLDKVTGEKGQRRFFNRDLNLFLKLIGGFGYERSASCSAFPYMLPDNNSPASGFLLSPFLKSSNCASNKSDEYYSRFEKNNNFSD